MLGQLLGYRDHEILYSVVCFPDNPNRSVNINVELKTSNL
jgi:hypothetical protein